MKTILEVLQVEDSQSDADLMVRLLDKAGFDVRPRRVQTAEDMRAAIEEKSWDVIISDFQMPAFDAFGALKVYLESGLDIPFIVVSGTIGEDVAVEMMRAGVHDYLIKDRLARLGPAVIRELAEARNRREKLKSDEQLRLLGTCVARLNDIVLITEAQPFEEPGPPIVFVNDAFVTHTGYSRDEVMFKSPRLLQGPKTSRSELDRISEAMKNNEPVRVELINYKKSGEEYWSEFDVAPVFDASGRRTHFVSVQRDVTERKRFENALRESEEHFRDLAAFNQKLVNEVNHRVRNNLAALLSVIAMTRKRATDVASFSVSIENRVRSLSLVHNLMSNSNGKEMELGAIVRQLRSAVQSNASSRSGAEIDGPPVWLDPAQILPLAYSLVELFGNCASHGAFSSRGGSLRIHWTQRREEAGSLISLHWTEQGVPIRLPVTPNLGMKLIEGFVTYDLGGRCGLHFTDTGLDHLIEFVVPRSTASDRSAAERERVRPESPSK